jgi:general secretion pathway protein C
MIRLDKHRGLLRRVLFAVYLATATFFLSHSLNAYVEQRLVLNQDERVTATVAPAGSPAVPAVPPQQLADRIQRSGLFPVPAGASWTAPGQPAAKPKGPPLEAAKKLRLLGTIIGAHGGPTAIIEEIQSKRQGLFHLHDQIPNVGEIADIQRAGVLIRQDEQEELLTPAILLADTTAPRPTSPVSPTPFAPPPRKVLDRRQVAEATSNVSRLLTQAHAVPHFGDDGMVDGFRLDFVAPASFFEKIGLQFGDMIQRINGMDVKDPGKLWTLFQQLRDERTVKVDLVRSNQPTTLTYEIR